MSSTDPGTVKAIDTFTVASGSDFTESSRDQVVGSGTLLFSEPLTPLQNQGVSLSLDFPSAGSSATLVIRASQPDLSDGIHFKISRPTGALSLAGQVQYQSSIYQILDSSIATYDPFAFDVVIDFVNQAAQGLRLLLYRSDNTSFTQLSADVDTHNGTHFQPVWPTTINPIGTSWGLILKDAILSRCRLDQARFSEN